MQKYKIVRMYFDDNVSTRTIKKGLTKDQAMEHCKDIQTSSSTCTNQQGVARTASLGAWFDGFESYEVRS